MLVIEATYSTTSVTHVALRCTQPPLDALPLAAGHLVQPKVRVAHALEQVERRRHLVVRGVVDPQRERRRRVAERRRVEAAQYRFVGARSLLSHGRGLTIVTTFGSSIPSTKSACSSSASASGRRTSSSSPYGSSNDVPRIAPSASA